MKYLGSSSASSSLGKRPHLKSSKIRHVDDAAWVLYLRIAPSRTSPLSAVRTWEPSLRTASVLYPPASAWFHFRKSSEYRSLRDLPSSYWSLHIAGFRGRARLAPQPSLLPIYCWD